MKKTICSAILGITLTSQAVLASQQLPGFLEENAQKTKNNQGWDFSHCGPVEDKIIDWTRQQEEALGSEGSYVLVNACAYGRLPYKVLTQTKGISVVASELGDENLTGIRAWKKRGRNPKGRALRNVFLCFLGIVLN